MKTITKLLLAFTVVALLLTFIPLSISAESGISADASAALAEDNRTADTASNAESDGRAVDESYAEATDTDGNNTSSEDAADAEGNTSSSEDAAGADGNTASSGDASDTDGNFTDSTNAADSDDSAADFGEALLSALGEHSGELLSLFAFLGSILLALLYKLGLAPLVRGALSSILNAMGVLKESVARSDESMKDSMSMLEERLSAAENVVKRLDEAIALTTESMRSEEKDAADRADMRLILSMQINMLYDIFMTSGLPQYEKDAVGERISAMNKILTERASSEKAECEVAALGAGEGQ